ncbi:MAG: 4a-hydroxytetrahydrobiopterin dehydratase [Melioribacteraceae bacterium]|nr:4a-hydroxytetrahydrobiopterin dehydratase [Melioribacteraceae bacterium]
MSLLSNDDIKNKLDGINNWDYENNSIKKEFELKDFSDALSFVVKVGIQAEKLDHHPDILIHSWNKVKINISTHSKGGVTENDFSLAKLIDEIK